MSKIMLVNVTHVEESRVAIVEDGVLAEYEIETLNRTHIKGNIYNAVVESVHPSLDAGFLKIEKDLKGFLPLDEVNFKLLPTRGERGKGGRIGQHVSPGQKLIVQVVREPFAGKPPTVSTYFSLPGRYLVLMPGVDSAGISRKIADAAQRDRLKNIVDELKPPEGFGLIVRTAGMGQTKAELQRDMRYLLRLWESIQKASGATSFPGLVYRERDLVIRTIRDYFSPDIREVWIDSKDTYDRALEFMRDVMPKKAKLLKLYKGERPLFNKFNLEEQIESIYKRRVALQSGGEIVIDGTEALTAIDVNSGRSRQSDQEEMATKTNVEAAAEISRQLRLRDLGGLIVIDFIDMMKRGNKKKVEKSMRDALKGDKARYDVTPISKLGLMEIARQRIKGAKLGATYTTCPNCDGYGLIKTVEAAALSALRKLQTRSARGDAGRIRVKLPTEVATWMLNHKREDLAQVERRHRLRIDIEPDDAMLRHESALDVTPRSQVQQPEAPEAAVVPFPEPERPAPAVPEAEAPPEETNGEAAPAAQDGTAPRRRRRRRRRRSAASSAAAEPTTAAAADSPAREESSQEDQPRPVQAEDEPEGEESGVRKRKRRRRRRRSATSRPAANGGDGDASAHGGDDDSPRAGIRSDELMPAAAGSDGSRGRGGSSRRRRRR